MSDYGEAGSYGWIPKDISSLNDYGTNGDYWLFDDNSSVANLINGELSTHTYSSSGIATTDQRKDSPTDSRDDGNGNFSILSYYNKHPNISLTNGNLIASSASAGWYGIVTSTPITLGQGNFYWESIPRTTGRVIFGLTRIIGSGGSKNPITANDFETGVAGYDYMFRTDDANNLTYNGSSVGATYSILTANDIVGWTVDTTGEVKIYINGTLIHTFSQKLNSGDWYYPCIALNGTSRTEIGEFNFGQLDYDQTAPSGFTQMCTAFDETAVTGNPLTGSFTGNASASGPEVWLGATPDQSGTCTINSNNITWGTHALPLAGGFRLITSSASYNASGSNTYSIATLGPFNGGVESSEQARAQIY
jgi:hypothetical protein